MSNKRTVNREAHYKNIIAKQKRIIQKLQKQVGRASKLGERFYEVEEFNESEDFDLRQEAAPSANSCPKCKGPLDVIDGSRMKVLLCHSCGYRASKRGSV